MTKHKWPDIRSGSGVCIFSRANLFSIAAMEIELSDLLAKKIDLRTPEDLSKYFRDEVVRTAQVQYALRGYCSYLKHDIW
jgi:hypothetical protein